MFEQPVDLRSATMPRFSLELPFGASVVEASIPARNMTRLGAGLSKIQLNSAFSRT
jgi:hypothetical protein